MPAGNIATDARTGRRFWVANANLATLEVHVFEPSGVRRVFKKQKPNGSSTAIVLLLEQVIDAAGQTLTYTYTDFRADGAPITPSNPADGTRLTSLKDASDRVTTLTYLRNPGNNKGPSDERLFLVTSISDSEGRSATFTYSIQTGATRLQRVDDQGGLWSEFIYEANTLGSLTNNDFLRHLDTPYGRTTFEETLFTRGGNAARAVEVTYPQVTGETGRDKFRVEYINDCTGVIPQIVLPGVIDPETIQLRARDNAASSGFTPIITLKNRYHQYRRIYVCNRKAMVLRAANPSADPIDFGKVYQFTHAERSSLTSRVLEAEIEPVTVLIDAEGTVSGPTAATLHTRLVRNTIYTTSTEEPAFISYTSQSLFDTSIYASELDRFVLRKQGANVVDGSGVTSREFAFQRWERNVYGRPTATWDAQGRKRTFAYATHSNVPADDPRNFSDLTEEAVEYLQGGTLKRDIVMRAEYDGTFNSGPGRPSRVWNQGGFETRFKYDRKGRVVEQIHPARADGGMAVETTLTSYVPVGTHGAGLVYQITERRIDPLTGTPSDTVKSFTYDSRRRVRTVTQPDGYVLTFDYDNLDRLTRTTHPDGTYSENGYAYLDRTSYRDRRGQLTLYYFNQRRELYKVTDPLGRNTLYEWCKCGGLQKLTQDIDLNSSPAVVGVTTWRLDSMSRVHKKSYADGKSERFHYDPTDGRLIARQRASGPGSYYRYWPDGNIAQEWTTDASAPTTPIALVKEFTYDSFFPRLQLVKEFSVSGATSTLSGQWVMEYGPYSAAPSKPAGRLSGVRRQDASGQDRWMLGYGYDERGQRINRGVFDSYQAMWVGEAWHVDELGRARVHDTPLGTFYREFVGQTHRPRTDYAPTNDALRTDYVYLDETTSLTGEIPGGASADRRLASLTYWANSNQSAPVSAYRYGYEDAEGTLKRMDVALDAAVTLTGTAPYTKRAGFTHDAAFQLKTVGYTANGGSYTPPSGSWTTAESYDYDLGSNRTLANGVALAHNNVNQVQASYGYSYDDNGSLVSSPAAGGGGVTYGWESPQRLAYGQLTSWNAPDSGGGTKSFVVSYDAFGRWEKVVETSGSGATKTRVFVWDGDELLEERDGSDRVTRRFSAGGEQQVSYSGGGVASATNYFYTRDHLGSVRELVDVSGTVRARYDYDAWGRRVKLSGDQESSKGYTGHYFQAQSGLHWTRWRQYDAGMGRWLSRDPIGEKGGINLYEYCASSPLLGMDSDGLESGPVTTGQNFSQSDCDSYCTRYCQQYGAKVESATLTKRSSTGWIVNAFKVLVWRTEVSWNCSCKCADECRSPFLHLKGFNGTWAVDIGDGWAPSADGRALQRGPWPYPEMLFFDPSHPPPIIGHYDYRDSNGKRWRIFPNGMMFPK